MAILKSTISLDSFTFDCQKALRKWEKTGLRHVAWDWDEIQKNTGRILNVLSCLCGIKICIYAVQV